MRNGREASQSAKDMTDPDRDRMHADLLLAEKRGKAALNKAETARDRMASRLAEAYQRPKHLAVGRDGRLRDVTEHGDKPLPTDAEVAAVVREVQHLRRSLADIGERLAGFH